MPSVNQIMLNPSEMQLDTVAVKYNKTVAQIVLRWSLQHGFLPLPKSSIFSRVESNVYFLNLNY